MSRTERDKGARAVPHGTVNGYKQFKCRCEPCKVAEAADQLRHRLKRSFNLTVDEYWRIVGHQGGVCAICGRPPRDGGLRLSIDHSHATGLVRGALCWLCNSALAHVRESPEFVASLLAYLESPPATAALGEERYGRTGRVTNKASKSPKRARASVALDAPSRQDARP